MNLQDVTVQVTVFPIGRLGDGQVNVTVGHDTHLLIVVVLRAVSDRYNDFGEREGSCQQLFFQWAGSFTRSWWSRKKVTGFPGTDLSLVWPLFIAFATRRTGAPLDRGVRYSILKIDGARWFRRGLAFLLLIPGRTDFLTLTCQTVPTEI
jgi:hypothetical protein